MLSAFVTQRLFLGGLMLAWCTVLVLLRMAYRNEPLFASLWWNLFLAAVPLICSSLMRVSLRRRLPVLSAACGIIWLLFLPNAPYILTDLFHLRTRPPVPLWLDLALLLSFAGTGLMFCYISLADVQAIVQKRFGRTVGWAFSVWALMLCGVGIYIGRYMRWNSWYLFTSPRWLYRNAYVRLFVRDDLPNPIEVSLVFGVGLVLGYITLRIFAVALRDEQVK